MDASPFGGRRSSGNFLGSEFKKMNTVVKLDPHDVSSIPFQEASLDIWDKKYRLSAKDGSPIDKTMDDTYKRVARSLAEVESEELRELCYERFLWALRKGAIPAGRIISNAGALEPRPIDAGDPRRFSEGTAPAGDGG